jgi:hypothetical protein
MTNMDDLASPHSPGPFEARYLAFLETITHRLAGGSVLDFSIRRCFRCSLGLAECKCRHVRRTPNAERRRDVEHCR